jgi:hypothetical protein
MAGGFFATAVSDLHPLGLEVPHHPGCSGSMPPPSMREMYGEAATSSGCDACVAEAACASDHSWGGRTAMHRACHTLQPARCWPAGQASGDLQRCMPPRSGVGRPLRARAQGWRFAFYVVAATSGAAAVAILALGTDPTPHRPAVASGKVRRVFSRSRRQSKALGLKRVKLCVSHASCVPRAELHTSSW